MAVDRGSDPMRVDELRTQLDELLRARQYAVQRERRLAAGLRPAEHGYATPSPAQDRAMVQQLAQARAYREQLGTECRRLSEQLLEAEEHARWTAVTPVQPDPGPDGGQGVHAGRARVRTRGSARHGGMPTGGETPAAAPPPDTAPPGRRSGAPVGARFGGAHGGSEPDPGPPSAPDGRPGRSAPPRDPQPAVAPPAGPGPFVDLAALTSQVSRLHAAGRSQEAVATVVEASLALAPDQVALLATRLRAQGPPGSARCLARSAARGPAGHVALVLALLRRAELMEESQELFHQLWSWTADRLVPLFDALEQTGQAADAATLLWESASAPPDDVAALAAALAHAGRAADLRSLLGQASSRSPAEVAALVTALAGAGRADEYELLLGAAVRGRQASDLAELGAQLASGGDPGPYARLLAAAEEAAPERRRDIAAALRLAGLPLQADASTRSRLGRRRS
ncbi:hypothetical protein [Peterkaempfera sp. SMS 1(5)a]|uniref:hypothetical protein n=1 Tax=Peterkaempfera podocarpi TaxID=3232308 RepID=UPI00367042E5